VYRFDVTGATDQLPTVYPNQLVVPPLIVQGSVNGTTWITFGTLIPRTEPVISAGPPATLTLGPATFWWETRPGNRPTSSSGSPSDRTGHPPPSPCRLCPPHKIRPTSAAHKLRPPVATETPSQSSPA
jgi:hypothetical protein